MPASAPGVLLTFLSQADTVPSQQLGTCPLVAILRWTLPALGWAWARSRGRHDLRWGVGWGVGSGCGWEVEAQGL